MFGCILANMLPKSGQKLAKCWLNLPQAAILVAHMLTIGRIREVGSYFTGEHCLRDCRKPFSVSPYPLNLGWRFAPTLRGGARKTLHNNGFLTLHPMNWGGESALPKTPPQKVFRSPPHLYSASERVVFWTRGLFRKVHLPKILENFEFVVILTSSQGVEKPG